MLLYAPVVLLSLLFLVTSGAHSNHGQTNFYQSENVNM